jgi:hypothetical protein
MSKAALFFAMTALLCGCGGDREPIEALATVLPAASWWIARWLRRS